MVSVRTAVELGVGDKSESDTLIVFVRFGQCVKGHSCHTIYIHRQMIMDWASAAVSSASGRYTRSHL
jgi:hypothetical protein